MSELAAAIGAFDEAQRRRRATERDVGGSWNDPEVRALHDRVTKNLDAEHGHAIVELKVLEDEVRRALELLAN